MSETELKPCPHCGEAAEVRDDGEYPTMEGNMNWWIQCVDCAAIMGGFWTRQEAVDGWNARADQPRPAVPDRALDIVEAVCAEVTSRSWALGSRKSNDMVLGWMTELRTMLCAAQQPEGGDDE